MGCHEAANRFWDICERIKSAGDYDIAHSTCSVLADLIEPAQDHIGDPDKMVDREALLALADKMTRMPQCDLCPVTVSCTEHADGCAGALMGHYARRTREACGEVG